MGISYSAQQELVVSERWPCTHEVKPKLPHSAERAVAICLSRECNENKNYGGQVKQVHYSATDCPDCLHALYWVFEKEINEHIDKDHTRGARRTFIPRAGRKRKANGHANGGNR